MTDLVTFVRSLIAAGAANGWQSFGQGSAWDGKELGQDIGLALGTPIPAPPGVVTAVADWGYGDSAVTVRTANGDLLTVGHMTPSVRVGQAVAAGDTLGASRGLPSPISSGPHIEFRVQPGGGSFVDPIPWLTSAPAPAAAPTVAPAAGATPDWRPLALVGGGLALLYWLIS